MSESDNLDGLLSPFLRSERMKAAAPHISGRVLDYGCGIGLVAELPGVTEYVGVDIDTAVLETASKRVPTGTFLAPGNVEDALAGRQFDCFVALALIEHLPDPRSFLEQAKRFIAPEGKIVITTPNPALDWAHGLGGQVGIFARESHEEHQSLMDRNGIQKFASDAGLRVAAYRRFLFGANQLALLTHQ